MSDDTRKDPRTKFVSLNVRYKSATVDEFMENHSHDVSKGGIFIKTNSPFASGTLLKFEIRLAADEPVIAGVGRVVWKREVAQSSGTERPAGMGIKFIKVDEPSKQIIDRIVDSHADAGAAFEGGETGRPSGTPEKKPVPPPPAQVPVATAPPLKAPPPAMKKTMMGLGGIAVPKPSTTLGARPQPPPFNKPEATPPQSDSGNFEAKTEIAQARGANFFPATNSEADMPPPEERTVMRQAAELLEEALKEAGGSMDEVGKMAPAAGAPATASNKPPALAGQAPTSSLDEPPTLAKAFTPSDLSLSSNTPEFQPIRKLDDSTPSIASASSALSEPAAAASKSKSGGGALLWLGLVAVLGLAIFGAYRMNLFGTTTTPAPSETASAPTESVTPPVASAPPADSLALPVTASASVALLVDAAPPIVVDAAPPPVKTAAATATYVAPVVTRPPTAATAVVPTSTATPTATATATTPSEPTTPTATPSPPARPTAAPKASGAAEDNPY